MDGQYFFLHVLMGGVDCLHLFSLQTDLAIRHHLSEGIVLSVSCEVSFFLYSSLANLTKLMTSFRVCLYRSQSSGLFVDLAL